MEVIHLFSLQASFVLFDLEELICSDNFLFLIRFG